MSIDLSTVVSVKLTKYGADRINSVLKEFADNDQIDQRKRHIFKEGDIFREHLWYVLSEFGDMFSDDFSLYPFGSIFVEA